MQDWPLEVADADRIGEFLILYEQGNLSSDDRFALMALVVASFDDWLSAGGTNGSVLRRIQEHLTAEISLHEPTIHYWCQFDESDPESLFWATPFMRKIWEQCS